MEKILHCTSHSPSGSQPAAGNEGGSVRTTVGIYEIAGCAPLHLAVNTRDWTFTSKISAMARHTRK